MSDMRTSPQPLQQDSETALSIKSDQHQRDLESDPELAQGLADGGNEPIERTLPPPPAPIVEQPLDIPANMDTLFDAPVDQVPAASYAPVQSPPPAPEPAHAILPAEQGQTLDPIPAAPPSSNYLHADQPMIDAPSSPGKISRERDDEGDEHGPAAKRLKADEETMQPEFKIPEPPVRSPPAEQRVTGQTTPADDVVTIPAVAGDRVEALATGCDADGRR